MNRLELISLFTAMKHLVKSNNLDALMDVIETVLREANVKQSEEKTPQDSDK